MDLLTRVCCRQPKLILVFGSCVFQCVFLISEWVCFLQLLDSGNFYGGKWVFKTPILQKKSKFQSTPNCGLIILLFSPKNSKTNGEKISSIGLTVLSLAKI